MHRFIKLCKLTRQYGFSTLYHKAKSRKALFDYTWETFAPTAEELSRQREECAHLWEECAHLREECARPQEDLAGEAPFFSVVTACYRTHPPYLREMVRSILDQTFPSWELILADASPEAPVKDKLFSDPVFREAIDAGKVRICTLEENLGISDNTNAAAGEARGQYLVFVDHDDVLPPNALYEAYQSLKDKTGPVIWYSDEDKITEDGAHFFPHIKLTDNEELLRRNNVVCHLMVTDRLLFQNLFGFRKDYDGAQDYDYVLRARLFGAEFIHVPKILYHWRAVAGSTADQAGSKTYAADAALRAVQDYLDAKNIDAKVSGGLHSGTLSVEYALPAGFDLDRDALVLCPEDIGELRVKGRSCGKRPEKAFLHMASFFSDPTVGTVKARVVCDGRVYPEDAEAKDPGYMNRLVLSMDEDAGWNTTKSADALGASDETDTPVTPGNTGALGEVCITLTRRDGTGMRTVWDADVRGYLKGTE